MRKTSAQHQASNGGGMGGLLHACGYAVSLHLCQADFRTSSLAPFPRANTLRRGKLAKF